MFFVYVDIYKKPLDVVERLIDEKNHPDVLALLSSPLVARYD